KEHLDEDAAQLAALGYTSEFRREMGLWGNISLGFTYLSPVVGVYTLFATSAATGGPPVVWAFPIVAVGQLMVALIFGEVVSQYPVAGGVYPWARRLWGRKWAWMTGWIYMFALFTSIAGIAYGAGPFLSALFGLDSTVNVMIVTGLVLLAAVTLINFGGTKVVSTMAMIGFCAELGGAVVVGFWLLTANRHNNLSVFFNTMGAGDGHNYFPAFAAAGLMAVFQFYGFEACGDVAEEVPNPGIQIPKAMRRTIYIGGAAATFVVVALVMAVPDWSAVMSGDDTEPINNLLEAAFGPVYKVVLAIVMISFLSCLLSLQAAASRLLYSYSRDEMIMGHKILRKFWQSRHVPPFALLLAGIIPAIIISGSKISDNAVQKIIGFAVIGIYMGFQMVVLAALRARIKGWKPSGKFRLGKWGMVVNVAALTWGILGILAMAWPWGAGTERWYDAYLVSLSAVLVISIGLIYMFTVKPYKRSDRPAGDALRQVGDDAAAESK
ncbi:MAG: APC family permease, partial [Propionibacteriaceae bacterium]|nr:APC family permease [Propionibacteriaceae bacterium]